MALKMILNTMLVLISRTKGEEMSTCSTFYISVNVLCTGEKVMLLDICLQTKSLVIMTPTGNAAGCKTLSLQKLQMASHDAHPTLTVVQCQ